MRKCADSLLKHLPQRHLQLQQQLRRDLRQTCCSITSDARSLSTGLGMASQFALKSTPSLLGHQGPGHPTNVCTAYLQLQNLHGADTISEVRFTVAISILSYFLTSVPEVLKPYCNLPSRHTLHSNSQWWNQPKWNGVAQAKCGSAHIAYV